MPILAQHRIKISYRGGLADDHALPGYDGATSIDGISRAVHIVTHAYMTGEAVSRATALRNASIIMKPARQGSFIFELIVLLEAYPATSAVVTALSAPAFYDFLKVAFRRATGALNSEPETAYIRNLYERREPPPLQRHPVDLDELAEKLEGSLQDAHRPIGPEGTINHVEIGRPRGGLVVFNAETKDWVNTRDQAPGLVEYNGNMTRYNAISRNGRAFIQQLNRVVPVRPDGDFAAGDLGVLTWSLHGSNVGDRNRIIMRGRPVTSASGQVKRVLLSDCRVDAEA